MGKHYKDGEWVFSGELQGSAFCPDHCSIFFHLNYVIESKGDQICR